MAVPLACVFLQLLVVCCVQTARGNLCGQRLGMEDGSIPDTSITASTTFHERPNAPNNCRPSNGRLNNPGSGRVVGGWCPARSDKATPWFQVDLVERRLVEGVIIQGSVDPLGSWIERVTAYQVQYSNDQATWRYVTQASSTAPQTFTGNSDLTTPVTSMFEQPIQARYIRIRPTDYFNWPSMRIELIGCNAGWLATTTVATNDCGWDGVPFENECFFIHRDVSKWLDADLACREEGVRLVTITDQAMNDVLADHIVDDVWIGLHDTHQEGDWRWVDDTPVNYTNFHTGDPRSDDGIGTPGVAPEDANCVALQGSGKWRGARCRSAKGRICARPRNEPVCSDGGTFFRDRCYWYGGVAPWPKANKKCEQDFGEGVKLAIVNDAELNAFLSRVVHPGIWLGLRYSGSDSKWRWVNGSPLDDNSYQSWRDGTSLVPEDDMCPFLDSNQIDGKHWGLQPCSSWNRFVCATQPCYDGTDGGSGAGGRDPDGEPNCLDFGDKRTCTCVASALCRMDGRCHCESLFDGMKCDKDELTVTIHAPSRLDLGSNITMRCHVNLPFTDVTVLWQKVSGNELFPEGRVRMPSRPEEGDYYLVIENLQANDTGSYVCAATTILGEISEVRIDSTYLHVAVPSPGTPKTGKSLNENQGGLSSKETGLIVAVAALSVCCVCLLVAFVVMMVRQHSVKTHSRRPSDMLM